MKEQRMPKKALDWVLGVVQGRAREQELRHYALFRELTPFELLLVHKLLHEREFKAGELVFEAGFPIEALYLIAEGEMQLSPIAPEKTPRVLKRHQFVGVLDLFAKEQRASTATALSDLRLLAIAKEDFWELVRHNPGLGVKILSACCRFLGRYATENGKTSQP